MKSLIEFLGMGQCFQCGGTITIREIEETDIELEPNGVPTDFKTISYIVYGLCKTCNRTFDIEKVGMSYKPVNRLKKLFPMLDVIETVWLNPFGYKKNERR